MSTFKHLALYIYWQFFIRPWPQRRARFISSLFTTLGSIARADGAISAAETIVIDQFATFLFAPSIQRQQFALSLIRQRGSSFSDEQELSDLRGFSQALLELCPVRFIRIALLEVLFAVASADDIIAPREETQLRLVAHAWNVTGAAYIALLTHAERMFEEENLQTEEIYTGDDEGAEIEPNSPLAEAYHLLELSPCCSITELKKAYRRLAMTHHPDRHKVASSDYAQAHMTFHAIQSAYEMILGSRKSSS